MSQLVLESPDLVGLGAFIALVGLGASLAWASSAPAVRTKHRRSSAFLCAAEEGIVGDSGLCFQKSSPPRCSHGSWQVRFLFAVTMLSAFCVGLWVMNSNHGKSTAPSSILVNNLPSKEPETPVQPIRLVDSDGDEGWYSGHFDSAGKAHGRGQLKYDEGAIFIGEFIEGLLHKGVAYEPSGLPGHTMSDGSWTSVVNLRLVSEFPLPGAPPLKLKGDNHLPPMFPSLVAATLSDMTATQPKEQGQAQPRRMADADGDEGWYSGHMLGDGRAHGFGQLQYDQGMIFIGEFVGGKQNRGVLYNSKGSPEQSMNSGTWENVDMKMIKDFPVPPVSFLHAEVQANSATQHFEKQMQMEPVRMKDADGDEGWYTGPIDKTVGPHGLGQLKYDQGMVFIGEFVAGRPHRGVLYNPKNVAEYTMSSGTWESSLDLNLVAEFALPVVAPPVEASLEDEKIAVIRMSDADGDEGWYSGLLDNDGRAHGHGELKYDQGMLFIGEFVHGLLHTGVAYTQEGLPEIAMRSGSWEGSWENVDLALVEEFPLPKRVDESAGRVDGVSDAGIGDSPDFLRSVDGQENEFVRVPLSRQLVPITSNGDTLYHKSAYYGTIQVGTPSKPFKMVFDTGSGHMILPSTYCSSETCRAHSSYSRKRSSTGRDVNIDGSTVNPGESRDQMTVSFGTGEVSGVFIEDVVCMDDGGLSGAPANSSHFDTVSTSLVAPGAKSEHVPKGCVTMSLVAATEMSAEPFLDFDFDGILGLGLTGLSQGTDFNFLDVMGRSLKERGGRLPQTFSVFLAREGHAGSEVTLGGWVPERLADGERSAVAWNRVLDPELGHWSLSVKRIRVDGEPIPFCEDGSCKAVADTGTSLLAVPTLSFPELYKRLRHHAVGGECAGRGPQLLFELEHSTISLGPEDYSQLTSPPLQTVASCKPMLMTMDLPAPLGPKLFIFGEPVLRKYYTVYDTQSARIGFGLARHP